MNKTFTLKSSKCKSLKGIIYVPGDKSISHRALIISAVCLGNSKIFGLLESDDVLNTLNVLKNLGVEIKKRKNFFEVYGMGGFFNDPLKELDFGNSGTGIRLMIGLLSTRNINATFVGDISLSSRPMLRVIKPLLGMNTRIEHSDGLLPVSVKNNNNFFLPTKYNLLIGSAQVKSALLLASLNVKGTTQITEYFPSRNHTEIMLKYMGADIEVKKKNKKNIIKLKSPSFLKSKDINVPGDFSSASFLIVSALLTEDSHLVVKNVGLNFFRTGLIDILVKMNANIKVVNQRFLNGEMVGDIEVFYSKLKGVKVDKSMVTRLIDEYPILFVAASFSQGTSVFLGLEELKFKESDRLVTMTRALRDAGVDLKTGKESLKIFGQKTQKGGNFVGTKNDHRIAMSMIVFGLVSENPIVIDDSKIINTSFPDFYEQMKKIGAKIEFFQK